MVKTVKRLNINKALVAGIIQVNFYNIKVTISRIGFFQRLCQGCLHSQRVTLKTVATDFPVYPHFFCNTKASLKAWHFKCMCVCCAAFPRIYLGQVIEITGALTVRGYTITLAGVCMYAMPRRGWNISLFPLGWEVHYKSLCFLIGLSDFRKTQSDLNNGAGRCL